MLGVGTNASQKDIRKQFLKKAREFHPDHNESSDAQEEFKKIKEAY